MNKKTKKGFTLVELLVVIAILAILATVSVVGYTSFIAKANLSNDQTTISMINDNLEAEFAAKKPISASEALAGLLPLGFHGDKFDAYSKGYHYAYNLEENKFYLVSDANAVVYPDNSAELSSLWGLYSDNGNDYVDGIVKYVALTTLKNEYDFDQEFTGSNYEIDLNGNVMLIDSANKSAIKLYNGIIGVTGYNGVSAEDVIPTYNAATLKQQFPVTDGKLEVKDCVITVPDNYYISYDATNVVFKNCVFTDALHIVDDVAVETGDVTITIEDCTFVGGCEKENKGAYNLVIQNWKGVSSLTVNIKNNTFDNCQRAIIFNTSTNLNATVEGNTFNLLADFEDNCAVRLANFNSNKLLMKNNTMNSGDMLVRGDEADVALVTFEGNILASGIKESAK